MKEKIDKQCADALKKMQQQKEDGKVGDAKKDYNTPNPDYVKPNHAKPLNDKPNQKEEIKEPKDSVVAFNEFEKGRANTMESVKVRMPGAIDQYEPEPVSPISPQRVK